METTHDTHLPTSDPRHVFVGADCLMVRWGKKRSAFYDYVARAEGFPKQVIHGRWRLDHVLAFEDAAAAGTVTIRPAQPKDTSQVDTDEPHIDDFLNQSKRKGNEADPSGPVN